jgi:nicotinamide mononucleotide transporter
MNYIEALAVLFTLLSVWLTTKRHVMSWPIGLFGIAFYILVFWQQKLYADFGLQFIFLAQGIYGAFHWIKNREDKVHAKIGIMTPLQRIAWLMIGMWVYLMVAFLLYFYTDASLPWVDSLVAVFSLIANWLLARRKIENWVIWIVLDVIYIALFASKGLYLSSGLYFILLVLAIKGFRDWKKCLAA